MTASTLKPKQVTRRLLKVLPQRSFDVLVSRYGLGNTEKCMTLEAIGGLYGITRERVRQIEGAALQAIRRSEAFAREQAAFEALENLVNDLGGIVAEEDLLSNIARDPQTKNHIQLLLVLGDSFTRRKEDNEFRHRWYTNERLAEAVHETLRRLVKSLTPDMLVPENELVVSFQDHFQEIGTDVAYNGHNNEEVVIRWLSLSRMIGRNPLGEWGIAMSPNVNVKGMRDCAYLSIRRHGSPMHFTEVARAIEKLFNRKAHVATCHNELIKDNRFVLVGRGLYALAEWGYAGGVVRDVIRDILEKHGPLTKPEVIEKVLKERYVKENTIIVNLENSKYFKKDKDGRYYVLS
jgi:hypothetical protein